jgi:hypothetical protein
MISYCSLLFVIRYRSMAITLFKIVAQEAGINNVIKEAREYSLSNKWDNLITFDISLPSVMLSHPTIDRCSLLKALIGTDSRLYEERYTYITN